MAGMWVKVMTKPMMPDTQTRYSMTAVVLTELQMMPGRSFRVMLR